MKKETFSYVDDSHKAAEDEVFCGFTCDKCAEGCKETADGKIECHMDGKIRDKDFTCSQWW